MTAIDMIEREDLLEPKDYSPAQKLHWLQGTLPKLRRCFPPFPTIRGQKKKAGTASTPWGRKLLRIPNTCGP